MTKRRAQSRIKDWRLCTMYLVAFPAILAALIAAGLPEFVQGLLALGFMFLLAGLINKQMSDRRRSQSSALDDDADSNDR